MFLVAPGARELASRDGADGETKAREANKKGYFRKTFSQKDSPQSRIRGFNRQARDAIEGHDCRVFVDQNGKGRSSLHSEAGAAGRNATAAT
jgi:hypothetical protein